MTQQEFKNILLQVGVPVYHFQAHEESENYIVWACVGRKSIHSDDKTEDYLRRYAINYYSHNEYDDETVDKIHDVLEKNNIFVSDESIVFDDISNMTLYAFTVEG